MKPVTRSNPNPFPGLRPFRSDEHHLFFGREEQTAALLQLLRTNRFLAVVGTSGSGKSSLVRAGMIAALHGGTMSQAGSSWEVMILRPGGSPIENLARAFVDAGIYDPEDPATLPRLLATLNRSRFGLVEAMKQSEVFEPGANLLVVVDQFEELFRFRQQGVDSEETAAAFVNLLLTASEQAECPIYVAITMRSDYLGDCSEIPGLAEAVNDGEYLIPRLLRDQKRDAIENPIGVGGARISPLLVQRLLNDVGDDPDQLPVLQHALMRTWEAWAAGGEPDRPIDTRDFEATGGLGAALSNHADEIYDALPDDRHRAACEKVFKALTVKGEDNRGIRRPTRLAQLRAIAGSDAETVKAVLDAFRAPGVTFLMPGAEVELGDRTVLDLSHESLMRGWERLRGWVEEEAQSARIFRRLSDTARLWRDGRASLFRNPDLQIAVSWRDQQAPNAEWAEEYGGDFESAIGFLEASKAEADAERQGREAARQHELDRARELAEAQQLRLEHQRHSARRLRTMIGGLAVVAVIAVAACVVAMIANRRANRLADDARQSAQRAEQSRLETKNALGVVESQKTAVEGSLSKAEAAEAARAAAEAGRKLTDYTTDMRLAPFVWSDDRTSAEQLRALLAKHVPEAPGPAGDQVVQAALATPDLRGFEWHYHQHLLEASATVFSGHGDALVGCSFTPDGQLVTLDQKGQMRRWDPGSEVEDEAGRRDLPGGPGAHVRVLSPGGRMIALAEGARVRVLDTFTGKEAFSIDSANNPPRERRLIFSRDGAKLVIVDDKIRWCNGLTGEVIASAPREFDYANSLALSADGLTLAYVGYGDLRNRFLVLRLDAASKTVTPLAKDVGLGGTLGASALSPDGRRLATGLVLAGALALFDTTTGRPTAFVSSAHASPISAIAFSGEGAKLVTADSEGTIKVWGDAQKITLKARALQTLKGHHGAIAAVAFSTDGRRLASVGADQTARVWDLENPGVSIRRLEGYANSTMARFSPDGQWIAVAAGMEVGLWDAATGRVVRQFPSDGKNWIQSVAFSPTATRVLAVGHGGSSVESSYVALWDIDAGRELARLPGAIDLPGANTDANSAAVGALAFSPDGKYLVAGFGSKHLISSTSSPHPLKVWEVASRRLVRRLDGHTNYCVSLDFSKDGRLLASGSRDGTAIIWSTETWKAVKTLHNPDVGTEPGESGLNGMVEDVSFSPDARTLALGSREGSVQLWDVATGRPLAILKGHSSAVQGVAFSPDGRTLASGGADQTVRLWNVEARREVMRLDSGRIDLGQGDTLAFSPDGKRLLVGGGVTAVWSAEPIVWNDPERAAEKLRPLLRSDADFQSRIRMLSENLRLHEALARLDAGDVRVQAALAAAQANWQASRKAWPEAAAAFDRLVAADPATPAAWLRTPGLLRLAMALLQQGRPRDAAALLTGGAQRRTLDGLSPIIDRLGFGLMFSPSDGGAIQLSLMSGFPGSRAGLVSGDVLLKVNDTELTSENVFRIGELFGGVKALPKVRLTVRHGGSDQPEVVEMKSEQFVQDAETGELLHPLRAAVNERLSREPGDPGLLELRAELAGQWSDAKAQAADYTAAIEALARRAPATAPAVARDGAQAAAADLKRLYARRGNAYAASQQWQQAIDDFARVVTDATTDETLLSNQALATAEGILASNPWTVLKPIEATSELGANLSILPDHSILVSGENPAQDRYHVDLTLGGAVDLAAVRLEALTDESLPANGPGRYPGKPLTGQFKGTFGQMSWKVTAALPDQEDPITLTFDHAWTDRQMKAYPIKVNGHWNIAGEGEGRDCTAIWTTPKPVPLPAGTMLTFEMQGHDDENLGHFRISVSSDPAAIDREQKTFAARKLTDPWQKLATAYRLRGKPDQVDQLVARRPKLAGPVGDLFVQGADADKDWQRAAAIYSLGITKEATDVELLSKRARAFEGLKDWDSAAADWSRAAGGGNRDGPKLYADFARRLAADGQLSRANAQYDKSQALYENSLQADPDNELIARELAQALLNNEEDANGPHWTVLKPSEIKSKGGATLTTLDDQSVLAGGENPDKDTFTVVAQTDLPKITAVRLEALAHESLGGRGPGRAAWGNFALSNFTMAAQPLSGAGGGAATPLKLVNPQADFEQAVYPVTASLDGNPGTAWSIDPRYGSDHAAVYEIEPTRQSAFEGGAKLTFTLDFQFNVKHALGRFRLSVTGDPPSPARQRQRFAAANLTDPWSRLAAAYALNGRDDRAVKYFGKALARADGYDARQPVLQFAAQFGDLLSELVKQRPDDPQSQLALARQLADRGKQRLAETQPAQAQAALDQSHALFTRLRAKNAELPWTVLTPATMTAEGGATLTKQADGSILVGGANPDRDAYTLVARPGLEHITAIRLEALPDPSLPGKGPGRADNGNFHLNELRVASAGKPASLTDITVAFDESQDFRKVIDGKIDASKGWSNYPRAGQANTAIVTTDLKRGRDDDLKIELFFSRAEYTKHNLGRFRLSVTGSDGVLAADRLHNDFKEAELVDLEVALAKVHARQGRTDQAVVSLTEALGLAEDRAAKGKVIDEAAALNVLDKLAGRAAADGQFQAELARHYAERGNLPLAEAAGAKARAWFEEKLVKEPENSAWAAELAQLLLDKRERENAAGWTIVKPTEMKSSGGATLALQSDGSILASGDNASGDLYTISATSDLDRVAMVRLEALPDPSLPAKGPGRHSSGNFQLAAFRLYSPADDGANGLTPLPLEQAWASFDFKASDADIAGTIDEKLKKVWHVWGRFGEAHQAVFRVKDSAAIGRGGRFVIELRHKDFAEGINLGRFRISVSSDSGTEQARLAAIKLTDPWARLAGVYQLIGDQKALDELLKHHPAAAAAPGDLYAGARDWERAITAYGKAVTDKPDDGPLLVKLADAYQSAGRTREAVPSLAKASSANPGDTLLSMKVAALQAWFGQEKEFAATRRRILVSAKGTSDSGTAERAAKSCSIIPSADKAELDAALALARTTAKGVSGGEWDYLALGMAEYRGGNYAAADEALLAAAKAGPESPWVPGISDFYRAMSLFRQGKLTEARRLAVAAAATMKPLPADEQNPLAGGAAYDDVILWLAYKEVRALLKIESSPIELLEEARDDALKVHGDDDPSTLAVTQKLADAFASAGRTREAVPLLAKISSAHPSDTVLSMKVAALQVWFGQEKELAATRKRILASAKGTSEVFTAERAAKACSLLPSTDKAELEAALAMARLAVELGKGGEWNLLALGMAEYRSGNYAAADEALLAAAKGGPDSPWVPGISAFYRAMCLFRQGKPDEARKVAIAAAATMKPLPADEQNPLAGNASHDDLILWLAYGDAKALIQFDAAPPPKAEAEKK